MKDTVASILLSFRPLCLGQVSCHVMKTIKLPYGKRSSWQGTEASYEQLPPTYQPCEGTTLKVDPPAPTKPSDEAVAMAMS